MVRLIFVHHDRFQPNLYRRFKLQFRIFTVQLFPINSTGKQFKNSEFLGKSQYPSPDPSLNIEHTETTYRFGVRLFFGSKIERQGYPDISERP